VLSTMNVYTSNILPPPSFFTLAIPQEKIRPSFQKCCSIFHFTFLKLQKSGRDLLKLLFGNHISHSEFHCNPTSSFRLRQDSVHLVRLAFYYNLHKWVPTQLVSTYTRHVEILVRTVRTPRQIDFGKQHPTL
jgi:hypothetical protein